MKIQEVTIEGYQSHTNSTFRLSPGLTVITGPSDAGKTAIIRALRWFAFNEPTGEAFLHTIRNPDGSVKEAVDQVKVSVTFDNGITITKTRRKGKTTYTHSAFPTAWGIVAKITGSGRTGTMTGSNSCKVDGVAVTYGSGKVMAPKSAKSGDRVAVIPYGTPDNVKYALVPIDYRVYTECGYYGGH